MLPDRVSNPGPLTYESGALPIALRGPAWNFSCSNCTNDKWDMGIMEAHPKVFSSPRLQ